METERRFLMASRLRTSEMTDVKKEEKELKGRSALNPCRKLLDFLNLLENPRRAALGLFSRPESNFLDLQENSRSPDPDTSCTW